MEFRVSRAINEMILYVLNKASQTETDPFDEKLNETIVEAELKTLERHGADELELKADLRHVLAEVIVLSSFL